MNLNIFKAKNFKQTIKLTIISSLGLFYFSSCNQESSNKDFDADGDVFIQKRVVDDEEQYAALYYIFGNQVMDSAHVTTPGSQTLALSGGNYTKFKEPEEEDFSTSMIATGEYVFVANYGDEETFQAYDIFSGDEIDVPVFDSISFNTSSDYLYLSWLSVDDADLYNVKLYSTDGDLVYNGPSLNDEATEYAFDANDDTWLSSPSDGTQYILRLNAYLLDSDADNTNWVYNFECNSYSETEITWGE